MKERGKEREKVSYREGMGKIGLCPVAIPWYINILYVYTLRFMCRIVYGQTHIMSLWGRGVDDSA